jgi:hypothetical protein
MLLAQQTAAPTLVHPAAEPADKAAESTPVHKRVQADRLMNFLRALPTKRSATGDEAHVQGLRDTEALIERTLREAKYEPTKFPFRWAKPTPKPATNPKKNDAPAAGADQDAAQPKDDTSTTDASTPTWHNIIAEVRGSVAPNDIVIIGAHFDSVTNSPGADDNGTGTAATMELARIFQGMTLERSVRFVFFNCEEPGLIGSQRYAFAVKKAMDAGEKRVVAMLSLEMLGYYCEEEGCQRSPIPPIKGVREPPTVGNFLAIATTQKHNWLGELIEREWLLAQPEFKLARPTFIPDVPRTPPDLLRSDHAPFLFIGVPAAIIADTANFRSPHYHQPTDTIDTLNEAKFVSAVRGLAGVVLALSQADAGPPVKKPAPPSSDDAGSSK